MSSYFVYLSTFLLRLIGAGCFVSVCLLNVVFSPNAIACSAQEQCIESSQFSVGVALGIGAKSNPVEGGEAIPQVVLLDIAWYGEDAYFDNGELGFRWVDKDSYSFESYITFDRERAFFSFWDPANIIVNTGLIDSGDDDVNEPDQPSQPSQEVDIDDISSRKWSLLAGGRLNYYYDSHKVSLAIESDISGVHSGQRILLSYQKSWVGEDWRFIVRPSVYWKSDSLIDYYYGLDDNDEVPTSAFYEGKSGIQPSISFLYTRKISDDWQFISSASYLHLHSGMTNSPLVRHHQVFSLFVGAGYRF